jgi:tocopherol cyclase
MNHFSPHRNVTFEGYYSKFRLPSGSSIALIISAVPAVAKNVDPTQVVRNMAFMISFTYVHPDSTQWWQKEYWPSHFDVTHDQGFVIKWDQGEFGWDAEKERVWWELDTEEIKFSATTKQGSRIPWIKGDKDSTPAGILANLPLPIQWHVHTLDSICDYTLRLPDEAAVLKGENKGQAQVHVEKNWALSFPESYIWIQGRDHEKGRGICIAGGSLIKGIQAYLVGYDDGKSQITFTPPTSTSIFGISLGLTPDISYLRRAIQLDFRGWFRRIRITANAPAETFFTLSAPLNTGHAPDYATQSFAATIKVESWIRSWPWTSWVGVGEEVFERGSLEFGGGFYKSHSE